MHELSIAMSIVDIATDYARKDNASRVLGIEIEVGSLSGVVVDALELAMEAATRNTICENASCEILTIQASMKCPQSGKGVPVNSLVEPCPVCGKYGHPLMQGDELRVKSLVVD